MSIISSQKNSNKQSDLMRQILSDQKYKGKHVIVVGERIFTANTGEGAGKILRRVRDEYPQTTPAITYIPDADTLNFGIDLNIDFETDCKIFYTSGIGGAEKVFLLPRIEVQIGGFKRTIPVGFLDRNEVPPLLGRHLCLETFEMYFASNHITYFSE